MARPGQSGWDGWSGSVKALILSEARALEYE